MDMEQQEQPVEAPPAPEQATSGAKASEVPQNVQSAPPQEKAESVPDLSVEVKGYYAAQSVGVLVRKIAEAAGLALGNVPAANAEPVISFVRWDDAASAALDGLARICGASWEVKDGTLHFVLG
jgi:hypothetical protein